MDIRISCENMLGMAALSMEPKMDRTTIAELVEIGGPQAVEALLGTAGTT